MLRLGVVDALDNGIFRMVVAAAREVSMPSFLVSGTRAMSAVPCGDALPLVSEGREEECNNNSNALEHKVRGQALLMACHEMMCGLRRHVHCIVMMDSTMCAGRRDE